MNVAGRFHLTYCSNIHPGETWQAVHAALAAALPRVRQVLRTNEPLGVGLRLSAQAAESLDTGEELSAFRTFLRDGNYYVFTLNGFPYGAFHGRRVKEHVYLPDWRSPARVDYTNRLARILASLLADHGEIAGSISTVPGAFKAHIQSAADVSDMTSGILASVAYLADLRRRTGTSIALALEPEPACYLETTSDAARFFEDHLFNAGAIGSASVRTGLPLTVDDVRRHAGVCADACHMAVEFEDPAAAFARLREAGVRVCKVQASAALRTGVPSDGSDGQRSLGRLADDVYLHQVVERRGGALAHYLDLPDALSASRDATPDAEWRVHFHVPVFLQALADLETTQPYLACVLDLLKQQDICPYVEVETYTWDVLPAEYRTTDASVAIARELAWVRERLES
jgi:sugar phosphate isomerase/epimerase